MTTPENEAAAAPEPSSTDADSKTDPEPIGENVEHHHDIADSDLPEDLQPDENPLAAGPGDDEESVSAFDPPGKLDGGQPADQADDDTGDTGDDTDE